MPPAMPRHHLRQQEGQRGQEQHRHCPQLPQQDITYATVTSDPYSSLHTPPHESTQDFCQAPANFPGSDDAASGEVTPRTLPRNAVTDDLDGSSYSAEIPHSLAPTDFIEPWGLDANMTLMTLNNSHEDMSDISTEDILCLALLFSLARKRRYARGRLSWGETFAHSQQQLSRPIQGSPLHIAATHGHINVAKTLLLHGSDINAVDKAGLTPIHYATRNNHGPMVTMLAEHGADVDYVDPEGCTPLHRASESGNNKLVERLLRHGAKLT
ncbi:ankyrin repeat-containing protein [Colletotrichum tofieldiae]|uniref:Ankyrin repeat-containing protein n=1 Tax=Colletotrichum tofieldiae TaxID=708197 RepID=A0A166P260_9PEZI|nr:ankyrin repeat-containing protein [Colletotrichum tofieldiae]